MEYTSADKRLLATDKRLLTMPQVKADRIEQGFSSIGMNSNRNVYFRCPICNQKAFTTARDKNSVVITDTCMNKDFMVILKNEEEGVFSSIW